MSGQGPTPLTPPQQAVAAVWEEHMHGEFGARSVEATLAMMTEDAYVNHVPVLNGALGRAACGDFYGRWFIPRQPPDVELVPVSRTVGEERVIGELIFRFTHTVPMEWMLPGVAPTGKRVEIPLVAIVRIRDGKVAAEHIYWDQASVLAQVGLLEVGALPVEGREQAAKVLDRAAVPSNGLIERDVGAEPAAGA